MATLGVQTAPQLERVPPSRPDFWGARVWAKSPPVLNPDSHQWAQTGFWFCCPKGCYWSCCMVADSLLVILARRDQWRCRFIAYPIGLKRSRIHLMTHGGRNEASLELMDDYPEELKENSYASPIGSVGYRNRDASSQKDLIDSLCALQDF